MKKVSPTIIVPVIAMAVVGMGLYGVSKAVADSTGARTSLVQEIADTFHLDKAKVQSVFDKHKSENRAVNDARYEERLNQAVKDNKLTSAQKEAVLVERKKLQSKLDSAMSDKTDRKTAMHQIRDEANAWAEENDIDVKWVFPQGPGRMHGMGIRHGGMVKDQ